MGFSSRRREMLLFLTSNMAAVTSRANQLSELWQTIIYIVILSLSLSERYTKFNSNCHPSIWIFAAVHKTCGISGALFSSSTKTSELRSLVSGLLGYSPVPLSLDTLSSYWGNFTDITNLFWIWSMLAGYEELAGGFEPIINEEIFLWIITSLIIRSRNRLLLLFILKFWPRDRFCDHEYSQRHR